MSRSSWPTPPNVSGNGLVAPRKVVGDGPISPRALASQASGHLAGPPLTREPERTVAVAWLKRGEGWLPATTRLLGLTAAASYLGVSTWVIRAWLASDVLARVKLPGPGAGRSIACS